MSQTKAKCLLYWNLSHKMSIVIEFTVLLFHAVFVRNFAIILYDRKQKEKFERLDLRFDSKNDGAARTPNTTAQTCGKRLAFTTKDKTIKQA